MENPKTRLRCLPMLCLTGLFWLANFNSAISQCGAGQTLVTRSGTGALLTQNNNADYAYRALGAADAAFADLRSGDFITLDLLDTVPDGQTLTVTLAKVGGSGTATAAVTTSLNGTTFGGSQSFTTSSTALVFANHSYTVPAGSGIRYVKIARTAGQLAADAVSYNFSACLSNPCAATAIGGTVFQDLDFDGNADNTELGVSGVTVTAYGTGGGSATSGADGSFSITGLTSGQTYRLEFSGIPAWLAAAPNGSNSNTSVQFVQAGACFSDLGLVDANGYCQANPNLITPCYVAGVHSSGDFATRDVLVKFPWSSTGTAGNANTYVEDYQTLGTVWGVGWEPRSQKLFSAAFLKRHSDFGGLGQGGIYVTDMSGSPVTSNLLDLAALGVDCSTSLTRDLPTVLPGWSYDTAAFNLVAKTSLGDLDLSADRNTLYVVNLKQNQLVAVDLSDFWANPAHVFTAADVTTFSIPNPGCSNGDFAAFGLKFYHGKVYVGVVCTAETSQVATDLDATVYAFDPAGATFTSVLNFPLDYDKGMVDTDGTFIPTQCTNWLPWTNDQAQFDDTKAVYQGFAVCHPQPVLSDIEFTEDGYMILGFFDRFGHQTGYLNASPEDVNDNTTYTGEVGGDILLAYPDGAGFSIENNAVADDKTGCGAGNNQGPGTGEFFCDDYYVPWHEEVSIGSLAYVWGKREVANTSMDPYNIFSNGLIFYNLYGGNRNAGYEIVVTSDASTFGKANGLGDLEAMCNAAPLEIGNLVWQDTDGDGVQDPGEAGIDGVTVKLFKAGNQIASTTTAGGGRYGFSNAASGSASGFAYNVTQLQPEMAYEIRIEDAEGGSQQANLAGMFVTTANNGGGDGQADLRDSDGSLGGSTATVAFTSGTPGANRHDFDFGFNASLPPCSIVGSYTQLAVVDNGTPNDPNDDYFTVETSGSVTNGGVSGKYETLLIVGVDTTVLNPGGTSYGTNFIAGINLFFADSTVYAVAVRDLDISTCISDPPYLAAACVEAGLGSIVASAGTCNGAAPNDDASIALSGVTNADEVGISVGATYSGAAYGDPSNGDLTDGGEIIADLVHNQSYTLRIWSGSALCYIDIPLSTPGITCSTPCPTPNCATATIIKN